MFILLGILKANISQKEDQIIQIYLINPKFACEFRNFHI